MKRITESDFSKEPIFQTNEQSTIVAFIEDALNRNEDATKAHHHLRKIDKHSRVIHELDSEITDKKRIEYSIQRAIEEKQSKIHPLIYKYGQILFGKGMEEESLEVVEALRSSTEWRRDREKDEQFEHMTELLMLQETFLAHEDVDKMLAYVEEEAHIIQRIAMGVCIGRNLTEGELLSYKKHPARFIEKLVKKVQSGAISELQLETTDYERAEGIYDKMLDYVRRARANKTRLGSVNSSSLNKNFLTPRAHIEEGIETIAE